MLDILQLRLRLKTKKVATMYCHLRPFDVMPLRTEHFGASGHQRLTFDGSIYAACGITFSASTVFVASVYGRWVKNSCPFSSSGTVLSKREPSQNKQFSAPQFRMWPLSGEAVLYNYWLS